MLKKILKIFFYLLLDKNIKLNYYYMNYVYIKTELNCKNVNQILHRIFAQLFYKDLYFLEFIIARLLSFRATTLHYVLQLKLQDRRKIGI